MSVLDILAEKKLIKIADISAIKEEVARAGGDFDTVLEKRGVSSVDILSSKAEYFGLPFHNLSDQAVPFDILKYVPEESAVYYKFVPVALKEGYLRSVLLIQTI